MTDLNLADYPTVVKGSTRYTLVGTAHVSRASADEVRKLASSGRFDAVAVELCESRYRAMVHPDTMSDMDLFEVFRQGKAGMVAASLALGAYQQRLAEQFDIEPGAEMKAAIDAARTRNLPVLRIDREVGTTLRRVYRRIRWWERMVLVSGLFASLLSRERVTEEEIEQLKQGDILESTFAEFAQRSAALYETLIEERDHFMAARLEEERAKGQYQEVLVVIGAGHLAGLRERLEAGVENPVKEQTELSAVPSRKRGPRIFPWVIIALILTGFVIGFSRSSDLGWQLILDWVMINGTLAAIGALLALAHPLSILTAFAAAPITSLNPTIGVGMVVALVEVSLRRPRVAHFQALRHDVAHLKGWWSNRVARTFLVFLFATIGSATGTYIAGFRIFERLVS